LKLQIAHTWDGTAVRCSEEVTLTVDWTQASSGLRIAVDAPYHADPPPPGPPGPTDGLWDFEVVELFLLSASDTGASPRYTEIELSPHGHHLVLELAGVRNIIRGRPPMDFTAMVFTAAIDPATRRWHGEARLEGRFLPPPPYRGNAYAIHGQGGERRYLARTPIPGETPDFHRIDLFPPLNLEPTWP
jgi:hypothetical protein